MNTQSQIGVNIAKDDKKELITLIPNFTELVDPSIIASLQQFLLFL